MPRPTVSEIDLDAIAFNLGQVRNLVGPNVKICAAVKADAYGHGAVPVCRTLVTGGVDVLAVASVEEAAEIRDAGIDTPILLLGCSLIEDIPEIVERNLIAAVCEIDFAQALSRRAVEVGTRTPIHIKIDTGMGRAGVQEPDALEFAREVAGLPGLDIQGIFTHLPSADDDLDYTREQIARFTDLVGKLDADGISIPIRHCANSAAVLNLPELHLEMVRPGILIYGMYNGKPPIGMPELRQAMKFKTRIVFLKELPAGHTVSYGRTYTTTKTTKVATIPVGYADGYARGLSNRAEALVHGVRVPVIGRVCMDLTMLDVTEVSGVSVGDEVVLWGRQNGGFIPVQELANILDTLPYEVMCGISKRVPRICVCGSEQS